MQIECLVKELILSMKPEEDYILLSMGDFSHPSH